MSEINRREVLAAVSAAAVVGGGLVSQGRASAAESGKLSLAASLEKVTAELVASASRAAVAATSPEDAYKQFMAVAGKGMMQVMADSLAAAVGGALEATKGTKGAGWEQFVKGCVMDIAFGAPINTSKMIQADGSALDFGKVLVTKISDSVRPTADAAKFYGGSISIGGSWTF